VKKAKRKNGRKNGRKNRRPEPAMRQKAARGRRVR
jgi:hypothetical protein